MDTLKTFIELYETKKLWMRNHEAVERNITNEEMYDFVRIAFKLIKANKNGVIDYGCDGWIGIPPYDSETKIYLSYASWLKFDCCGRLAWTSQEWKIGYERALYLESREDLLAEIIPLKKENVELKKRIEELENKGHHLIIDGFRKMIAENKGFNLSENSI